jgi:hypothetical protein
LEIQIDPHTLERTEERGASEEEIRDVINTGIAILVKYDRMGKAKTYDFKQRATADTMTRRKWRCFIPSREML